MKILHVPNFKSKIPREVLRGLGLGLGTCPLRVAGSVISRRNFFCTSVFLFSVSLLISCKPPLPVYFDAPIGTKVQGFDTAIAGNYIPLDNVIEKGTKEFSKKYNITYDKILLKDTTLSFGLNEKNTNYEDIKDIIGTKKDSRKEPDGERSCDSLFNVLCEFRELVCAKIALSIDKQGTSQSKAGIVKIAYDRVFFISVDSDGNNMHDTLISLTPSVLLTKYSGSYFLNFRTEYGWEIMQLEVWENCFLSVRPFYFTDYDQCAKTVSELTHSTKSIYSNLKPILNANKKVIGFKAVLDEKLLVEKIKKGEELVLLLRIK